MGSKVAIAEKGDRTQANVAAVLPPSVHRDSLALLIGHAQYAGDPTNNLTPQFIGEYCMDTANAALYWASTAASSGWKKLTP